MSKLSQGTLATGLRNYTYSYNAFGQRVTRNYTYAKELSPDQAVVYGELLQAAHRYTYDHFGRLIRESCTRNYRGEGSQTETMVFLYDETGVIGMEYALNGSGGIYYFHRNPQGDVVGIYDVDGNFVARYIYDAWGNCTVAAGTVTNAASIANANPFRYRGYYYDSDTGLYYCNARYYSPKWRRFISPDDTSYIDPETVNGLNLYCYCNNDPVNMVDPSGHMPNWAKWLVGGVAFAAVVTLTALTGGALAPMFIQMGASIVLGGVIQGAANAVQGESFWDGFADGAANGALTGGIFALGHSVYRTIKVASYASKGLTIGKMGTFEQVGQMTGTSHYGGLKSHGTLSKVFGESFANKVGWVQNKSVVQGVMKFNGVIYNCGGELSGAYAKEVALTRGYQYLVDIWLL